MPLYSALKGSIKFYINAQWREALMWERYEAFMWKGRRQALHEIVQLK